MAREHGAEGAVLCHRDGSLGSERAGREGDQRVLGFLAILSPLVAGVAVGVVVGVAGWAETEAAGV